MNTTILNLFHKLTLTTKITFHGQSAQMKAMKLCWEIWEASRLL